MRLTNFRAFAGFTISFGSGAYLVGPNNAGKSTVSRRCEPLTSYFGTLTVERLIELSSTPTSPFHAYPLSLREFPALRDGLRHEFSCDEVRLELTWTNGSRMIAVWPKERDDEPADAYFYLLQGSGFPVKTPQMARKYFPELGVIPVLGPIEHTEELLSDDYVNQNISGRLSSRHFRNQLRLLDRADQFQDFLNWASEWLGEVRIDSLQYSMTSSGMHLQMLLTSRAEVASRRNWSGLAMAYKSGFSCSTMSIG